MEEFNPQIFEDLAFYVYALIDPSKNNEIFYIGKGTHNRVFQHQTDAHEELDESDKLNRIRDIESKGFSVKHIIIRHGLTEAESLKIESSLIDLLRYQKQSLTNLVLGHDSDLFGLKTVDEINRLYALENLDELKHKVVIININKNYVIGRFIDDVYDAVKEAWVISEKKQKEINYVLAEYLGRIVGVFKIKSWYLWDGNKSNKSESSRYKRYGFIKDDSIDIEVVNYYLNKSIRHHKKRGQANPIRYKL